MQQHADIYLLQNHSTSLQRDQVPTWPRWREVAAPILWPVPEAAVTVFSTPDDGCCDTRNMYSYFAVNKYLRTVASSWIFYWYWIMVSGTMSFKKRAQCVYCVVRFLEYN